MEEKRGNELNLIFNLIFENLAAGGRGPRFFNFYVSVTFKKLTGLPV